MISLTGASGIDIYTEPTVIMRYSRGMNVCQRIGPVSYRVGQMVSRLSVGIVKVVGEMALRPSNHGPYLHRFKDSVYKKSKSCTDRVHNIVFGDSEDVRKLS